VRDEGELSESPLGLVRVKMDWLSIVGGHEGGGSESVCVCVLESDDLMMMMSSGEARGPRGREDGEESAGGVRVPSGSASCSDTNRKVGSSGSSESEAGGDRWPCTPLYA
jgi:hypothetical protein